MIERFEDAPWPLREPCRRCGWRSGVIRTVSNQDVVRCDRCNFACYNAPRSETGRGDPADEKKREARKRRKKREEQATGSHTQDQWMSRRDYYNNRCVYCGTKDDITKDHRIPLERGGANWPSNLKPACRSCNSSKGTKTETEFKQLLEKTK